MANILKKLKKKSVWISLVAVVAVSGFFVYRQTQPATIDFSSTVVERIDLIQSVEETGTVKSQTDLSYGWEVSGRVASVERAVGDEVDAGDVIATLENSQERSRLQESLSLLAAAQAQLNLRLVGASQEQIASSLANIASAEAALLQSRTRQESTRVSGENAIASAQHALTQAQNVVERALEEDQLDINEAYENGVEIGKSALTTGIDVMVTLSNLQESYSELVDGFPYGVAVVEAKKEAALLLLGEETSGQRKAEYLLGLRGGARGKIDALTQSSEQEAIDDALFALEQGLIAVRDTADVALTAFNRSTSINPTDEAELVSARANINSAISLVIGAEQTIAAKILAKSNNFITNDLAQQVAVQNLTNATTNAQQNNASAAADVVAAEAALAQANASHKELIADPRSVDVASLRADVSRQSANVAVAQEQLRKTELVALANGVIARIDVEEGETVTANQEIFALVSRDLNVEVDISETDIAKIAVGDVVEVTLDAFGDDRVFMGEVAEIDPAETEISGVIYYKTAIRLELDENNTEGVRPGMTANVKVVSQTSEGALVIPRRAVLRDGDRKYVRVITNESTGEFEERDVTTGLEGDDGLIEVLTGLSEGDNIITFINE